MDYTPSPIRLQLSSAFGSISFACWMILMVPQLIEQWRLKTVDGISPVFLLTWFAGDLFNLIGSLWGNLLPEVILIAIWFLIADSFTLGFYYYIKFHYDEKRNTSHHIHHHHHHHNADDEELLLEHGIHEEYGISSNRQSERNRRNSNRRKSQSTLQDIIFEPENHSVFITYILPILLVISAGIFGSFLSPNGITASNVSTVSDISANGPQLMGYLSALFYLTARLPQIYHNYTKKSTSGLSLLFFLFTMLGNITYSLQIITYRSDWYYIKLNFSWLLGSLGTIIQDLIIVSQFYNYRKK